LDDELERMLKEELMAYSKALFQHFPEAPMENLKTLSQDSCSLGQVLNPEPPE
jgi:hypothetical protein